MLSRPRATLARSTPIAFSWTISAALCLSPWTLYCLVYPTSYIKGIESNHFDTHNSPVGMHLHHCVCHTTLQFSNDDPKQHTQYAGSCLILPRGVQYNYRLYPSILELQNHCGLLIDPTMGESCPLEVVGDFRATDPIFKGCYGTLSCIPKLTWPD